MTNREIEQLLGNEAESLLKHQPKISRERLHLPGPDFVDRVWVNSDRSPTVLRNLQLLFSFRWLQRFCDVLNRFIRHSLIRFDNRNLEF